MVVASHWVIGTLNIDTIYLMQPVHLQSASSTMTYVDRIHHCTESKSESGSKPSIQLQTNVEASQGHK